MRSFGICILVALSILCGKATAGALNASQADKVATRFQGILDQLKGRLQKADFINDVNVETTIRLYFQSVDTNDSGDIDKQELMNLGFSQEEAVALINPIETQVQMEGGHQGDINGALSDEEVTKYILKGLGADRANRIKAVLSALLK